VHCLHRCGSVTIQTGVLVIGAGAAGLRAAIELRAAGVDCLVVGKRRHGDAHTRMAAGGINASLGSLDPEDRWEIHAADTIREGGFICQPRAVELLAREAPDRVLELAEWGCEFDRLDDGGINQRYFGAQSFRRTCFVGDVTGEAVLATLVDRACELGVPHREHLCVREILVRGGAATGALAVDLESGEPVGISAAAVVVAAGGCTSLYRRSSSRDDENTGDAVALAYHAGAELRDMEMIQFHPTGMVDPPEMRGRLVTEAVRGEGGHLLNAHGERFMERYAPDQMELAARDVVARVNYQEIRGGRGTDGGGVLLDISHVDASLIRERLPRIYHQFLEQGIDITKEPMEVAPTAHYPMGGIKVDPETGATRVPGLCAVGEATSGVHGANRLGGNSLAETVVFGRRVGRHLAETGIEEGGRTGGTAAREWADAPHQPDHDAARDELMDRLRDVMWDHAGIVRSEDGLREGLGELEGIARDGREAPGAPELGFALLAAEAILRSALLREESRGAHCREDAPEARDDWRTNIVCARGPDGAMSLRTEPVPPVPDGVQRALDEHHALDYHHLE
jgi:succinate dehydrogenase / fumarate reductase, flavoprotein subunit